MKTPKILHDQCSAAGKIGGPGNRKDKVRAGHLGMAKRLRNLAKKATAAEAAMLISSAERHERKAAK